MICSEALIPENLSCRKPQETKFYSPKLAVVGEHYENAKRGQLAFVPPKVKGVIFPVFGEILSWHFAEEMTTEFLDDYI